MLTIEVAAAAVAVVVVGGETDEADRSSAPNKPTMGNLIAGGDGSEFIVIDRMEEDAFAHDARLSTTKMTTNI